MERGIIGTPNTQIHEHSLSWLGTVTSIKVAGFIKFDGTKPVSEIMPSCKYLPHVSKYNIVIQKLQTVARVQIENIVINKELTL